MKYTEITKEFTEEFFKEVDASKNIIITSHFSPDGDSISSVLSMYRIITDKYKDKNVKIVYSNELDEHFKYFENFEKIEWVKDVSDYLMKFDLLIMLDCGNYSRFTKYPEKIQEVKNQICIDHHASLSSDFKLSTIIPSISSCSELIFRLFEEHITLDKNLAETFLLGILTDTGNFAFLDGAQSETLLIAKKLIDAGNISINTLRSNYIGISKREFNLVSEFIKNTSFGKVEGWPPFQYTFIRKEFIESENYTSNEIGTASSSYIAGYLTSLAGYTWGFIVKPKSNYCSVSMRALPGSVNVRDIVERMSIGGGHDRAAAGIFKKDDDPKEPRVCIEKIIEWMENNKPQLTK